ncbi:MAG: PrsW family intramembrane metalloprotease, partial [Propionibacteriaceae bacterium]|nr:PrsW family intramembrane metalloprotease [Propionibacteriaceae bacterium]
WLNGLSQNEPRRPWWQRLLRHPLFWMTVILLPLYFWALHNQYWMLHPEQTFEDGTRTLGLSNESIKMGAYWAMWTALVYTALFIWLDRFRASSPVIWLLTLGWGACASTWFSIHINTWMGQMMATTQANSDSGSRAAVFSAPFVEEFAKATILILLVILWRNKIVSRLSIITLAGLSAVGFAFTENIIYYARVWMQATHDITIADPKESFMELVMLRGVYTSFGHPLFTMMTAGGLAIGLGARSKWVRVMAPVAGYLLSCAGHMLFNGLASTNHPDNLRPQWFMALGLVLVIIISLVVSVVGNGQVIRARLGDYQRAGWLTQRDVELYGGPLRRAKLLLFAIFRGPRLWWRTAKLVRRVTELAYLRNAMVRGTVGGPGDDRAHELIVEIHELQKTAFSDYAGQPMIPPRKKKRRSLPPPPPGPGGPLTTNYAQPVAPGPAGVGGNYPVRS